jgi:Cdc6-like AAA superfamily ATPase
MDAYRTYEQVCQELALRPKSQRRMVDLIAELEMAGMISSKIYSKGRHGRTREIQWILDSSMEAVYHQQRAMHFG